jgi:ATP adenylyltransferase
VNYKQLWAPWRLAYIKSAKDDQPPGCFLCRYRDAALDGSAASHPSGDAADDAANFVVHRSEHSLVVLNRFPYNNGHLLVAPSAHKSTFAELTDDELLDCQRVIARMVAALQAAISPEGFNIGANLGKVAGAGLPGHLHWHIVPRWSGDTNFMSIIDDVTVIPQSLQALYELLQTHLKNIEP